MKLRARFVLPLGLALCGLGIAPRTLAQRADAPKVSERGLDLWVHGETLVPSGKDLALSVVALGFPTATTAEPLEGALVEASWDVPSLTDADDPPLAVAPAPVTVTTAKSGGATLIVPVPPGRGKELKLLLRLRFGEQERTFEHRVQRSKSSDIELFVSDSAVVPGSRVMAWGIFSGQETKRANTKVEFLLRQGDIVRQKVAVTTDASGTASAPLDIPAGTSAESTYFLVARVVDDPASEVSTTLRTREEIPGAPTFDAAFDASSVIAGSDASYRVRVRDASGEPIKAQPVLLWSGPSGTEAPTNADEFAKVATKLTTDENGEVAGAVKSPSTIPARGTELKIVVRTELEGATLSSTSTIAVGKERGYVRLTPEASELVPGLSQRVVVELAEDGGKPITGSFIVKGDALDAKFTTNEFGEAEFDWNVPAGIGAHRGLGPCANSVAAQVTIRAVGGADGRDKAFGGALVGMDGLSLCVPVQREARMVVRPSKLVAKAGETISLSVQGSPGALGSVLVRSEDSGEASVSQADLASKTPISVKLPTNATGAFDIHVAVPQKDKKTTIASTRVLVLPDRVPEVAGTLASQNAAPGATITIDAQLKDDKGAPLTGSIAAIVVDKFGGARLSALWALDTRTRLCQSFGVEEERCQGVLLGAETMDPIRRARLRPSTPDAPLADPAGTAVDRFDATFRDVVRSLEGAVFESSMAVETLPDVQRKEKKGSSFNPELMTLVTDALSEPPQTPGGEPIQLADLMLRDPQITYDNVARRVTRLKLFRVLEVMRDQRAGLDPDEPSLTEPNAFLRKLVRDGAVSEGDLLDPWGGRLRFEKSTGEYVPFITWKRGFSFRSAGPDGKINTKDDVDSPFVRVLESDTPYARASDEDAVVDARFDMRVADSTVSSWRDTLDKATGTALGSGGLGLSGIGEGGGGTGHGFGSGSGRMRGAHRRLSSAGFTSMAMPVETDEQGRARIQVQLGDEETTWRVILIGLPHKAPAAVSSVDVPVSLALSSKVAIGAKMTEGDKVSALVHLRNRTATETTATVEVSATGALTTSAKNQTVTIPAKGAATLSVPVVAGAGRSGTLVVKTTGSGTSDEVRHDVEVLPRGEVMNITKTAWVSKEREWADALDKLSFQRRGQATLTLTRGLQPHVDASATALRAFEASTSDELLDVADLTARLTRRFNLENGRDADIQALDRIGDDAVARLTAQLQTSAPTYFSSRGRLASTGIWKDERSKRECPPEKLSLTHTALALSLDAEPVPDERTTTNACWSEFTARAVTELAEKAKPADIARAIVSLSSRPHRQTERAELAARLLTEARPDDRGELGIDLPSRSDRATVYAALILSTSETQTDVRKRYLPWLLVQRDGAGGYGSIGATRAATMALLASNVATTSSLTESAAAEITIDFGDGGEQTVKLDENGRTKIAVPKDATDLVIETSQPIFAEMSRDFMRPFEVPAALSDNRVRMDRRFPSGPECTTTPCPSTLRRGDVGNLVLRMALLDGSGGSTEAEATIPLPPGVVLASRVNGVRQVAGSLIVNQNLTGSDQTIVVPLRFTLAGSFTLRESTIRNLSNQEPASILPAQRVEVADR